ncbi:MAG: hypothetical protein A3I68_05965 [Candidatus Melainabacteria bacterium RIFCSPLOWO2_02_FULL_35_15]|nr:MAG: hypothetical protein A3F80_02205 [Candidatus Melainabacteria bacterium RIFCSPLOWO2_12_FULL_35_11]OGI13749.1 MAG: hypothetical protein A3I68_05965 [Candidatus Melainabacteria bacterium RIFCSPLOWO2_02_FULL_35_15]
MSKNSNQFLQTILWFVAIYHIILGCIGIFAKDLTVVLARTFFNFNLILTDQISWVLNPFSAYLLIFGVFMALAATNPSKYKTIIYIGIALCAIRIAQRIFFFCSSPEGLINNVDPFKNMIVLAVVVVIGISMLLQVRRCN